MPVALPRAMAAAAAALRGQTVARERFVDGYLAALLAQASKLISAEFHAVVRAGGLPVAHWRILATLAGGKPVPVGRLAQIVLTPQPTVTRQLERMAGKGLVERSAHATDRRLTLARITPQGEALARGLIEQARAHERKVLAPFGRERAALLKAVLKDMIEQHRRPAERGPHFIISNSVESE